MTFADSTYFELFGLPEGFAVNQTHLDEAYRTIQAQIHPDRFASQGAAQKRIATQWSTRANDAYQTLKDPLKRAIYILHLRNIELGDGQQVHALSPAFLMQQIEWREGIEAAASTGDSSALDTLLYELQARQDLCFEVFAKNLEVQENVQAINSVRELMFLNRLIQEAKSTRNSIEVDCAAS